MSEVGKEILAHENRCQKIQKEDRHNLRSDMQNLYNNLEDKVEKTDDKVNIIKEHVSLINLSSENMQKDMKDIKDTLNKFIDKADKTFATKQELTTNDKRITKLENGVWWIIALVGGILISAILYSIMNGGN